MGVRVGFLCLAVLVVLVATEDVSVKTNVGTFIGFRDTVDVFGDDFEVAKFLGVPYAEPPVGDLRFRKPVAKATQTEPLETKTFGSPCMQCMTVPNPQHGSEDCLFLNVFAPASAIKAGERLPVMIWMHGGGFTLGSANGYIPDSLVATGPVVAVTINYRLSVWGFLSTVDASSPGNYGLWDQHLAIKWVHDNIDKFGGDPNRVTIFGNSAGSASVVFQGCYPGNRGLFQRIIAQSGSSFALWGTARSPVADAQYLAGLVGCGTENSQQMVDCLRGLDNNILNATMNDFSNGLAVKFMTFVPYSDGDFVTDCSKDSHTYSEGRSVFSSVDLMIGITSGEGYLFTPPVLWMIEEQYNFMPNRTHFQRVLVPFFVEHLLGLTPTDALIESIVAEYTDWNDPENPEVIREQYLDMLKDSFFLEPMWRTIDRHASITLRPASYMYYFTAQPSKHAFPTVAWASKPNHGDELIYVFGGKADLSEFGITELPKLEDWERSLSNEVMTIWTNFAKTGNPNTPRDLGLDWLPYTRKHQHYLDISRRTTARNVKTRLDSRRAHFWSTIVPAISNENKEKVSNTKGACERDMDCSKP